ncbi:MAG: RNA-binding domain-containing protein [Candidatus Hadarchaeaceae archaeon]
MEFPFSSAVITLHVHATEDEQKVLEVLRSFLPSSVEIRRLCTQGHHGNPIVVFESRINQKNKLEELWRNLLMRMDEAAISGLRNSVRERMDESCFLYLRFEKQSALGGRLVLTKAGDSVHLRLKVKAFPAKREIAANKVMDFLKVEGNHAM